MTILAPMSIGSEIRRVRRELDMTQTELANKCNITQREISFYENGKTTPTNGKLETIAKALGKEWKLQ